MLHVIYCSVADTETFTLHENDGKKSRHITHRPDADRGHVISHPKRKRKIVRLETKKLHVIIHGKKRVYIIYGSVKFMISSDSSFALQALGILKTDHPLLIQI